MRRAHGAMEFRRLWEHVIEDRRLRSERPGERLYLRHATENSETEVSTWPFPETVRTFMAIKAKAAPLYQNRSTVESVDLLMTYDAGPFAKRVHNTPVFMIVAEGDDLTLWDLEINAFNAVPSPRKTLHVLPHTTHMTHMTLSSDASKAETAAKLATNWFSETM